ncbi:MAG: VWA domain-containing protein [Proteobacteria bacterium]|jgi:Ca-activated chloride channel homolog|nr:VWA domain-containing protein [Pseudomonadota bacterium]
MFFADLWFLGVLIPLYLLWVLGWFALGPLERRLRFFAPSSIRFSSTARLQRLKPSWTIRLRPVVLALRLGAVALLVLAMARPQTGKKHTEVVTQGVDIFLAIDASGSMSALDLDASKAIQHRPTRLDVVKKVVARFIEKRANDQIGIVVFGTEAFTQCPLTLDHGIVTTFLSRVTLGVAGDSTAIGSAIGTAVKRLRKSTAKSKVVVLLTDGRSNAGIIGPKKAAEIAKKYGIKVYVIGAGTRGKAPILVDTMFGPQVEYIEADIDEPTMESIANMTNGAYFRAEDVKALDEIYDQIDQLERTEIKTRSYMEYNERFNLFVLPALALLLLEILLLGTRFRRIP